MKYTSKIKGGIPYFLKFICCFLVYQGVEEYGLEGNYNGIGLEEISFLWISMVKYILSIWRPLTVVEVTTASSHD